MSNPTFFNPDRHGEFVDGRGKPLPYSLFGMDEAGTDQFIEWSNREDAILAGERELESQADDRFVSQMEARDAVRVNIGALQARTSDPLAALDSALAELNAPEPQTAAEPAAPVNIPATDPATVTN